MGGRNNRGRITTRHQGGGHKRRYRKIDFKRVKDGVPAKVASIEIILTGRRGSRRCTTPTARRRTSSRRSGCASARPSRPARARTSSRATRCRSRDIPTGTVVHAVELRPGQGAKLARSAGSGIQLVAKDAPYGVLRLPSGEMRRVLLTCRATVGQVGNTDHANESSGKAGRSRWLGKRPSVRGTAMNPVDHPHGGGEGKSKGHHPVTPWGVPTIGKRTRRKHKESDQLIVRGRRRGKERR